MELDPKLVPSIPVLDSDGRLVGQVSAVHGRDLLVERGPLPDLTVSFDMIGEMAGDLIVQGVPADLAEAMGCAGALPMS